MAWKWLGRTWAALPELWAIRPGLEEVYWPDGVYPALALAYQGLAEMRRERRENTNTHLNWSTNFSASPNGGESGTRDCLHTSDLR